ncbi:hypothetical protein CEK26_005413 [Fusarium fujikuroi]|uniref:Uncharacterized protein n=1 Tax=Fusarium fujikuroi TaxID=5127 RepID=A0A5Q3D402_FUSFU|nr:uncharacterized protein Y057_4925 [Fusarium fujikuroi]KLP04672.1 uncharacterized protein LW94_9220 [Fusarium fujikuroi]QGI61446.1 hypothetical protein CEK27_005417 [Fusarium fujikuroi]QGI78632.1 hypothetical protein CEK25_005361 [Fusarium fujikuroi]QGI92344.1 hypothetical protein CEK26_005413 [Fusarium fujikuroi]
MLLSLAIIGGLAALSQGYVLTAYKNVDNCEAEGDTNYRIYEGDYDGCQKFGGQSGSTCTEYSNGGTIGPNACSSDVWEVHSVALDGKTQISGAQLCYTCTYYTDENCGSLNESPQWYCDGWEAGPKSFRCVGLPQIYIPR